jgi:hypothetical protein
VKELKRARESDGNIRYQAVIERFGINIDTKAGGGPIFVDAGGVGRNMFLTRCQSGRNNRGRQQRWHPGRRFTSRLAGGKNGLKERCHLRRIWLC